MNYRHAFHAGGYADIVKHVVLIEVLRHLTGKDKPLLMIDTHAGRGGYDLGGPEALRSGEASRGIARLMRADGLPGALLNYVHAVRSYDRHCGNGGESLRYYPGSPRLMRQASRAGDRLVLCELEAGEALALRREFAGDRRVEVRPIDGFDAPAALLPPLQRRALVLIDPPYERSDDGARALRAAADSLRRLASAVILLWYPIKADSSGERLVAGWKALGLRSTLAVSFHAEPGRPRPAQARRAPTLGCGVLIANPPWQLENQLRQALDALPPVLGGGVGELHLLGRGAAVSAPQAGPAEGGAGRRARRQPSQAPKAPPTSRPAGRNRKTTI